MMYGTMPVKACAHKVVMEPADNRERAVTFAAATFACAAST